MKLNTLKHFGIIISLLLTIVLTTLPARAQVMGSELTAMNSIRDNYGWGTAFGWNSDNPCPQFGNPWNGVTCELRRVSLISRTCGTITLTAPFPTEDVRALTAMTGFDLQRCYTQGTGVPASQLSVFGRQLTRIRIDGNKINGTISEMFPVDPPGTFPTLGIFYISDTGLSGTIPSSAYLPPSSAATLFRYNVNRFSGVLPPRSSPYNANLWLNGNAFEGVLPDYLVNIGAGQLRVRYNKLDVVNTPPGNVDTFDPGWRNTQTVPPTNVQVVPGIGGSAILTWTPIAYQAHGGYYEVLSSQTPGGPYTPRGTTANSGGKTASTLTVTGLPGGTTYFIVRAFTPAHTGVFPNGCTQEVDCVTENNPNNLTSVNSAEESAVILGPTAAAVSISGRVLTNTNRGLMNAIVYLTDSAGNTRAARTNPFGYYLFNDISAGQTVIISVVSKRYQFAPRVLNVSEDIGNLDFVVPDSLRGK